MMDAALAIASPPRRRVIFGRPLMQRLVERAAEVAGIPVDKLVSRCHRRNLAYTRFAVMLVAREQGKPLPQIALKLNKLDHTSIAYGVRRARELEAADPDFAELVRVLREEASR